MDRRFEALEARFEGRFTGFDQRFSALDTKIDHLTSILVWAFAAILTAVSAMTVGLLLQ